MPAATRPHLAQLMFRTQIVLELSTIDMASYCGVSRNTVTRWKTGASTPPGTTIVKLARDIHARDPELATSLAHAMGETLETLGIAPSAPSPSPSPTSPSPSLVRHLAGTVLLAAAEAMDQSPNALRPFVLAAFERADAVGLTVQDVLSGLRPSPPTETAGTTAAPTT